VEAMASNEAPNEAAGAGYVDFRDIAGV
jgi:hypothetical protein